MVCRRGASGGDRWDEVRGIGVALMRMGSTLGLGAVVAWSGEVRADEGDVVGAGGSRAPGAAVLFLEFDGAEVTESMTADSSLAMTTVIPGFGGTYAAYGDGPKRQAVVEAVRSDFAAYNVEVVDVRPESGNFTECVVSPSNPFPGGLLGIAVVDCEDMNENNLTFAFHAESDSFTAAETATTIGQEIAHSFGLEHVDDPTDIMNPVNGGGDPSFRDECINVVGDGTILCGAQHQEHCGVPDAQNAHMELLDLFGPSGADMSPPTVTIIFPEDGDAYNAGVDLTITAEADDNLDIDYVELYVNGELLDDDNTDPYQWTIPMIAAGVYELQAIAFDTSANSDESELVTVYMGVDPPNADGGDESGGTSDDTADGGDAPSDDGAETGDGSSGGDAGATDSGNPDGCGCHHTPRTPWPLLLALPVGLRRRR